MVSGKDRGRSLENKIRENLPEFGSVQIVSITDKQYKKIKIFNGKQREKNEKTNSYCCFKSICDGTLYRKASTDLCFQSVNAYPV
jgi:CRISPR/Cas system-associated protein endoribonuclease Cas2